MSNLTEWQDDNIKYILNNKKHLTKELLAVILETHRQMSVLDHLIKENEKLGKELEANTAHGHGGNDNIPQPDPNAGPFAPMIRTESENTDHPAII